MADTMKKVPKHIQTAADLRDWWVENADKASLRSVVERAHDLGLDVEMTMEKSKPGEGGASVSAVERVSRKVL